jgi:tripartite-type tricarboxylate transporter receptor subunit TctC
MRVIYAGLLATLAVAVSTACSYAQDFPARPVIVVVPFAAGGPTDTVGRILAEHMRHVLGQPVIIENAAGAAGSIGTGRVARAAPDGHTLVLGDASTHVVNGAIYNLSYDVAADFEPVAMTVTTPLIIVGKKGLGAQDLKGLIAWLKASPGRATQGIAGAASQLAGVQFQKFTGTQFVLAPYRGAAPAVQDLISGHIDLMIPPAATVLAPVRSGQVKAFAVASKARFTVASDIPSVDEAGLPGFYSAVWQGLWAPRNTPTRIIARLNAAVLSALADPRLRARLAELGQEVLPREQQTAEALGVKQRSEIQQLWPVIRAAGIKAD